MGGNLEGTPAFLLRLRERFGPVTQFRLLTRRIWVANEPAVIRDVLVTKHQAFEKSRGSVRLKRLLGEGLLTSEEPLHLRQRRLLQPAFHRDRLALYGSEMVEEAEHQVESWHDGDTVDVVDAMTRLTLVIATRTLFGSNIGRETEEVRAALSVAMELFPRSLSPASELLDRLPIPATRQFARARSRLDAVVGRLVAKRRESGIDTGDLLSMLLLARDAVDGQSGMSDAQVRDEAMTIFLAGHETTANALAWTLYLLSEHPRVRERLEDEVDAALAGRAASAEDVPRLPYARSVLSESMRLFPPAWIVGRRALRDVAVGGYELRRGEVVLMSQYVVHRDPRFYDEPEAFRPERWSSVAAQALPRFAYFPFGAGNRVCIGEQFAWMEGLLVLTALTRRWRLDLVPGTPVALQPVVTLRPRYPMPMVVHARSAHASASRDGSVRGDRKAPSERVGAECTLATAGAPRRVQSRMDPATTALETETATFAGGCFWGVESDFRSIPGVLDAVSGYTGGTMPDPTYRAVCSDRTGHAEAVRVTYDPSRVSYRQLVEAFWKLHDPTTPNRQGPDVGSQYRSAIFTHSPEQTAVAEESKREAQARFSRPIVTQIVPATEFYPAEDYHQRYFEKQGITRH